MAPGVSWSQEAQAVLGPRLGIKVAAKACRTVHGASDFHVGNAEITRVLPGTAGRSRAQMGFGEAGPGF